RTTVIPAAGIIWPDGVGLPPVHRSTMSPMSSVTPSALTVAGAGTLAVHPKSAALATPVIVSVTHKANCRTLFGRHTLTVRRQRDRFPFPLIIKDMVPAAKRYFIRGRVQGVGFRYFVERVAAELKLTGYTRNLDDGRVEVYAVGPPEKLNEM